MVSSATWSAACLRRIGALANKGRRSTRTLTRTMLAVLFLMRFCGALAIATDMLDASRLRGCFPPFWRIKDHADSDKLRVIR